MRQCLIGLIPVLLALSGCAAQHALVAASAAPADAPAKTLTIIARKYHFTPKEIVVKRGTLVRLTLKSEDVTHGFALKSAGINVKLPPGQTVEVTFYASQRGEEGFACSNFCGIGHLAMDGRIIVQ
ncbi:MAG: cupredoxin domain-containing protein [Candidatus Latescibacteria bacterium]|nr:cupredoxin domain-containing protein [Candidatus Latescibacterota bacterium]